MILAKLIHVIKRANNWNLTLNVGHCGVSFLANYLCLKI